jgi:branched-subunit amino acid transport protein AzlD
MMLLLAVMTAISASMRLIPFVFSKWMSRWSLLEKLAAILPLCISILLVAHLLDASSFKEYPFGVPQLSGIASVIFVQALFRKILLSMGVGVLVHQLLLHCL